MITLNFVMSKEFDERIGCKFGADCTPEDFPDVALEDTPHHNKFEDVNIDLRHQDKEWLEKWRKFTGVDSDDMDNEDPWVVTVADPEVSTPEANNQYLSIFILLS